MSRLLTPGQRIKMRLMKLDMTETELAQKIGMDPAHLLYIMNGQVTADAAQKTEISRALNLKEKAIWKH
jgi:transcriptional regulator with XRE-family HTH domain